jgi:hypothetical protein
MASIPCGAGLAARYARHHDARGELSQRWREMRRGALTWYDTIRRAISRFFWSIYAAHDDSRAVAAYDGWPPGARAPGETAESDR